MIEYKLIRSQRKTLALQIKGGELIVRAPIKASDAKIEEFVRAHGGWIDKHLDVAKERARALESIEPLTADELSALRARARVIFSERAAYYAELLGVSYRSVTVRFQRTRWGSCTAKGDLNFNGLLLLAPPEVLDGVVAHELCHRKEMNHSARFYAELSRVFPEYKKWRGWLKENGESLLRRLP